MSAADSTKALLPTFYWAQDKNLLYMKIDLTDVSEEKMKVNIDRETFSFSADSHDAHYEVSFKFRFPINAKTASYSVKRLPEFLFEKETSDAWWPHLLSNEDKTKFKAYCKVDWAKFVDEDDAEDEGATMDTGGVDWSQMAGGGMPGGMGGMGGMADMMGAMGGMGGMGGMPGMGGMAGMPGMEALAGMGGGGLGGLDFSQFGGAGDDTDSDDGEDEDDGPIDELGEKVEAVTVSDDAKDGDEDAAADARVAATKADTEAEAAALLAGDEPNEMEKVD
jgi:hypothetical protein